MKHIQRVGGNMKTVDERINRLDRSVASSFLGNYILDKVIMNQMCLVHSSRDASYRSTPVFDHDPLEFNHIRLDFSNLLFRSRLAGLQTDLACSRRFVLRRLSARIDAMASTITF